MFKLAGTCRRKNVILTKSTGIMDESAKIKIIERFDCYYDGINNKGAFILTSNTFLIGAFIVGYDDLIKNIALYFIPATKILIATILLLSVVSIILSILAIIPYLKSDKNNKSNWFFNDIATIDKATFLIKIEENDKKKLKKDMNIQIYYLAKGLRKKHCLIRWSLICNLIGILTIVPIIIFILIQ